MKCTNCGEREGVVSLTQIEDGEVRTGSLCAQCAKAEGIDTGFGLSDTPLGGFLAALGEGIGPGGTTSEPQEEGRCGSCGATLKDFRETGRVGCADCYRSFDPPLRELLRRIHGSTHHTGERPEGAPVLSDVGRPAASSPVLQLREELRRAVEAEQFERAAELRDRLREHE
jgi:protein arginine kinase activator